MLSIKELRERQIDYSNQAEGETIEGFILFIEKKQAEKGSSVISLEAREARRRLRELKERQEANKPFNPEEEFKNLKL